LNIFKIAINDMLELWQFSHSLAASGPVLLLAWPFGSAYPGGYITGLKLPSNEAALNSRIAASCLLFLMIAGQGCDQVESTLGGDPGGQALFRSDSLSAQRTLQYHRPQQMLGAIYQTAGRVDSLGLESVLVFQLDYTPTELWDPQPDSAWVDLSFKMSNDTLAYWFPNDGEPPVEQPAGSRNIADLDLLMLEGSGLVYDDLAWEQLFDDGGNCLLEIQDSLRFRVNDDDVVYGDDDNPLDGRRTYRRLPLDWFQAADTTQRTFALRMAPEHEGLVQLLAAGWTSELRPGVWFHEIRYDTLTENDETVITTVRDSSFVTASWQSSVIRDTPDESSLSLSSGWASQILLELPPLIDSLNAEEMDPLLSSFVEVSLLLPLAERHLRMEGAKVNAYTLSAFDSSGVDLESWQLVGSTTLADGDSLAEINLISHFRQIWVEEDSFVSTDPVFLALKLDDYSLLQLRKLEIEPTGGDTGPRLRYRLSSAPDEWRQP
jgi:hypothetical protein